VHRRSSNDRCGAGPGQGILNDARGCCVSACPGRSSGVCCACPYTRDEIGIKGLL
jgi:hypothetical protein